MSDEQRITKVEKEKDPRKVEAGRKLSMISKAAKEKKAKQRAEMECSERSVSEEYEPSEGYSTVTVLTGVGVLAGLVCLYFTYRQDRRAQTHDSIKPNCQSEPLSDSNKRGTCKIYSLDD